MSEPMNLSKAPTTAQVKGKVAEEGPALRQRWIAFGRQLHEEGFDQYAIVASMFEVALSNQLSVFGEIATLRSVQQKVETK